MTNLQALQSLTAYSGSDLLTKVLLDRSVTGGDTYGGGAAQKKKIDLCLADLYFYLAGHPEVRMGSGFQKKYTPEQLRGMAEALYKKHDEETPNIDGEAVW